MLNYKNVLQLLIYLISSTPVCCLCPAIQSGCSEGQQSPRWLPVWWMMGTGGADPGVIRTLSWQGLPLQASQRRQREMDVQLGGWMDGWMRERQTQESYGTGPSRFFCVISSPHDPCDFLLFLWLCILLRSHFHFSPEWSISTAIAGIVMLLCADFHWRMSRCPNYIG